MARLLDQLLSLPPPDEPLPSADERLPILLDAADEALLTFDMVHYINTRLYAADRWLTGAHLLLAVATGAFFPLLYLATTYTHPGNQRLLEPLAPLIGLLFLASVLAFALASSAHFTRLELGLAIVAYLLSIICLNLPLLLYTLPQSANFAFLKAQKDLCRRSSI